MEIEELKKKCKEFLDRNFDENESDDITIKPEGKESYNETGAFCTIFDFRDSKESEISLWCDTGWYSENGFIQEKDVVYFLCLERGKIFFDGQNKEELLNTAIKKYGKQYYDEKCWDSSSITKEKQLFFQFYFNRLYVSYCFKDEKKEYHDELNDFFKQLIDGNFISDEEIEEKYCRKIY